MALATINGANIYYEESGRGTPFVMVHAGVADSRQWNGEFEAFADRFRVIRFDQRGFGKTGPLSAKVRPIDDLEGLLDHLDIDEPVILMGCSMGGTLAMDFTLAYPDRVAALIMVASGPSGLQLDVARPDKFKDVEAAWEAKDIDRTCELETQIWFDGMGRTRTQVDPDMRQLLYDMNHLALEHELHEDGERLPNLDVPAAERLDEINVPVLIIVGEHDLPYMHGAADVMVEKIRNVQRVNMADAAHLPNMDHPRRFQQILTEFLARLS